MARWPLTMGARWWTISRPSLTRRNSWTFLHRSWVLTLSTATPRRSSAIPRNLPSEVKTETDPPSLLLCSTLKTPQTTQSTTRTLLWLPRWAELREWAMAAQTLKVLSPNAVAWRLVTPITSRSTSWTSSRTESPTLNAWSPSTTLEEWRLSLSSEISCWLSQTIQTSIANHLRKEWGSMRISGPRRSHPRQGWPRLWRTRLLVTTSLPLRRCRSSWGLNSP